MLFRNFLLRIRDRKAVYPLKSKLKNILKTATSTGVILSGAISIKGFFAPKDLNNLKNIFCTFLL